MNHVTEGWTNLSGR